MSAAPQARLPDRVAAQVGEVFDAFASRGPGRSVAARVLDEAGVGRSSEHAEGWSVGGDVVRPAASLLKLPLVMAVLRAGGGPGAGLAETVAVGDLPQSRHPGLIDVLDPTTLLTRREVCSLCLATSDNPLAVHLLDVVGEAAVRALLDDSGCRSTRLEVGFDDGHLGPAGRANVTTAWDMVRLVTEVVTAPDLQLVATAMGRTVQGDRIPLRLRPELRTGHKSGTLAGVCDDVGFLTDGRTTMVLAFLCDGEADVARTGLEIGDCARDAWRAVAS